MHKTLSRLAVATILGAGACVAVQAQAAEEELLFSLNDPMAAFLETRAYAARMGATAEFRKMEGVALDEKNGKIYIAMSSIDKTMSDDKGDIQLPENKCGIVYEGKLDSNYNISELKPAVIGGPYDKSVTSEYGSGFADKCATDNIASPDGLYVDKHGNLWISEDTSSHVNNMIWRWDGKELKRFATVPTGAEITGVHVTANDELFFNVQHPSAMSKFPYNRGVVGVINGFKSNDSFSPVDVPKGNDVFDVKVAAGEYQVLARVGEEIPTIFTISASGRSTPCQAISRRCATILTAICICLSPRTVLMDICTPITNVDRVPSARCISKKKVTAGRSWMVKMSASLQSAEPGTTVTQA